MITRVGLNNYKNYKFYRAIPTLLAELLVVSYYRPKHTCTSFDLGRVSQNFPSWVGRVGSSPRCQQTTKYAIYTQETDYSSHTVIPNDKKL